MTERHFPRLDPLCLHSRQYFGQCRALDGKVKVFPHFRHFLVMVSTGRYFALHSWQQSGQLWTFSGRVKVFPHILHVLVTVPRSVIRSVFRFVFSGYRSLSANSFFNHANIVFAPLISAFYCFFYCSFYCSEVSPDSFSTSLTHSKTIPSQCCFLSPPDSLLIFKRSAQSRHP